MPEYLSIETREVVKETALDIIIQDIADVGTLGWRGDDEVVAKLRDCSDRLAALATKIEKGD